MSTKTPPPLQDMNPGPSCVVWDEGNRLAALQNLRLLDTAPEEESLPQISERIRAAVDSERLKTGRGTLQFTGSFGIALSSVEDTDWRKIYARADMALYEAKTSGKNRVVLGRTYVNGATGRLRALGFTHG
jgi:GGDEF domain-containing protein